MGVRATWWAAAGAGPAPGRYPAYLKAAAPRVRCRQHGVAMAKPKFLRDREFG